MKKNIPSLESLVEIPENIVMASASFMEDEPDNNFKKILEAANEYKKADMTPVYILDKDTMNIYVVALETFGKKLN
jgi:hypothetical protein